MGKQTLSLISQGQTSGEDETSNSNSSTVLQNPSKRLRNGPFKNCSGRFKGVVPQQNGNWGAQIYANHQRIWLGTFKSEEEAAMAYDSAAIKLRSGDSHRNFPWTPDSIQEPSFQSLFRQEAVLGMIRDGSYRSKFENYLRNESRVVEPGPKMVDGFLCRQLFQKELTPSDVGKLNRLVIPKKYAVKYLPRISDKDGGGGGALEDVQLVFYDRLMRMWKFRYCYWSSSQSFVFTRGWSRFVKEKDLRANDMVSFSLCECTKEKKRTFCMIDVGKNQQGLQLVGLGAMDLEPRRNTNAIDNEAECVVGCNIVPSERGEAIKQESRIIPTVPCNAKGVWLFGVQIN